MGITRSTRSCVLYQLTLICGDFQILLYSVTLYNNSTKGKNYGQSKGCLWKNIHSIYTTLSNALLLYPLVYRLYAIEKRTLLPICYFIKVCQNMPWKQESWLDMMLEGIPSSLTMFSRKAAAISFEFEPSFRRTKWSILLNWSIFPFSLLGPRFEPHFALCALGIVEGFTISGVLGALLGELNLFVWLVSLLGGISVPC